MKVLHQTKKVVAAIFSALFLALMTFTPASAADVPEYRLQISPAKEDIGDLKPGETYTGILKVQNTGQKAFDFAVGVSPYSVADENYTPTYDDNSKYTDIVNWVTFSQKTGSVEPNGEVEVAYTIKVPADVPAGGQYAVLTAEITNSGEVDNTGVSVVRRVGMILYSNVKGNTRKEGSVIENKISSILFNPPISATSIVENKGNTHATVKYVMKVFPLFSDEEVYTNEEDPATLTLLPDTRRLNTITWNGSPSLGIFRVQQTVSFWDQTSTTEKIVFICPIWLLFIVLLLIFCAIFWIVSRIRNRNK